MALLEARGLIKIFGKLTALDGADLTVAENEFHGLIGPNGSGKSTLMKCVKAAGEPRDGAGEGKDDRLEPLHLVAEEGDPLLVLAQAC